LNFPNNPYPDNTSNNGFYNPEAERYRRPDNFQDFSNGDRGNLSRQNLRAIKNIIAKLPKYVETSLQLAGEDVVWLRQKISGTYCPYYNDIDDESINSKCQLCYGTNFLGGFDPPVILKMSFIPGKSDVMIEEAGLTVVQKPTARCGITNPVMSERDIIVSFSNERYRVHAVEVTELQGHKYEQQLTLSRVDKNDVVYYVPVPGIMGQVSITFPLKLTIRPIFTTFPLQLQIRNYFFNPHDGLTN